MLQYSSMAAESQRRYRLAEARQERNVEKGRSCVLVPLPCLRTPCTLRAPQRSRPGGRMNIQPAALPVVTARLGAAGLGG